MLVRRYVRTYALISNELSEDEKKIFEDLRAPYVRTNVYP